MSGSGAVLALIRSGERELLDSAILPGDTNVRLHLAPRKLLVYLLFTDSELYHCVQEKYLNAFADMYSVETQGLLLSVAPEVGGAVLAGDDSAFFCDHVNIDRRCNQGGAKSESNVCVAFRWAHNGEVHTRMEDMPYVTTQQNAITQLQNSLAKLSSVEHASIPSSCWVASNCGNREFSDIFAKVCTAFVQSLECEPSLTLQTPNMRLEPTGVFVRVVPKDTHCTSDVCFHGVVLCQIGKSQSVKSLCGDLERSSKCIEIHEMFSEEIRARGLHLCAVQAERVAVVGLQEKHCAWGAVSHGSGAVEFPFLIQRAVAVRPIDESLVASFDIYPCKAPSCFPGQFSLRPAFKCFFDSCNQMARSAVGGTELPARFHGSSITLQTSAMCNNKQAQRTTEVLSPETTIGSAAARFLKKPAEVQLGLVLLQCAGALGVGATVRRAVSYVWQVLRDVDKPEDRRRETVEAVNATEFEPGQSLRENAKRWVDQILELQGLAISKGGKCVCGSSLDAETAATKTLAFLIQMETGKRPEACHMQSTWMQRLVKSGFPCGFDTVQKNRPRAALECAVLSFQSEFGGFENTDGVRSMNAVFLLETRNELPYVQIMRHSSFGGFENCNLAQFAKASTPTVVLVHVSDKRKRMTTIRLAKSKRTCNDDVHATSFGSH